MIKHIPHLEIGLRFHFHIVFDSFKTRVSKTGGKIWQEYQEEQKARQHLLGYPCYNLI